MIYSKRMQIIELESSVANEIIVCFWGAFIDYGFVRVFFPCILMAIILSIPDFSHDLFIHH